MFIGTVPVADSTAVPKRFKKSRRWLIILAVLGGLLLWLNGPGLRFFAPRVTRHFLEKSGLQGTFVLGGSFTGGLHISGVDLKGDRAIAKLSISEITPTYHWRQLLTGKLQGLRIRGLHVELCLGGNSVKSQASTPLDFQKISDSIRTIRSQVLPIALDLSEISLTASQAGKTVFQLAPSSLSHQSGETHFALQIGSITDATGRLWSAQDSSIDWSPDSIAIDRINPLPGISLSQFSILLAQNSAPSLATQIQVDDAHFTLTSSPGFTSASLVLREGQLSLAPVAQRLGQSLPVSGNLTALTIELDQLLPAPHLATGTGQAVIENLHYQQQEIPRLSLQTTLNSTDLTLALSGKILTSAFTLKAAAPVTRFSKALSLGDVNGQFTLADPPAAFLALARQIPAMDSAATVPASNLVTDFQLQLAANRLESASATLQLSPADSKIATPIALSATWSPKADLRSSLLLDGFSATATFDPAQSTYQAALDLDSFNSACLAPWLALARVKLPGTATVSGKWQGTGALKSNKHQGSLSLAQATWSRLDAAPILGNGSLSYDWPLGFELPSLKLQMADQSVTLAASMASDHLTLHQVLWATDQENLLSGSARFPIPKDLSKWRETLIHDTRPIAFDLRSKVLPLSRLSGWVPTLNTLDSAATCQLDLKGSGTYASPLLDAKILAANLHSATQPSLPPAALELLITARENRLQLTASATAPDFAPALISAAMPFRPATWAENPASLQSELITARADLPKLDLSRFVTLIPPAEKLSGSLTGNLQVSGSLGTPVVKGSLALNQAALVFKDRRIAPIDSASAAVEFDLNQISLKSLKATIAGGRLSGDGTLKLNQMVPSLIDFRLRADHLPILRNDFLILRANADLRLNGPYERATLSGTIATVDGIFYRDIELLPIGTAFTGPSAAALPKITPPASPASGLPVPFRNWPLDLQVVTEQPFLIRGNLANGQITGKLRIGGTLATPAPDGSFVVKDFAAALPFSTLTLRTGNVRFTPASGFDPIIEFRGLAEPRPYRVTLYAYGPASNPQLILTSNPPLPENEIMTLLATGTTTSGLEDPQAASSRAMQLLAEELRRGRFRYGKQLRPLLKLLDRVDFSLGEADPYSTDSYSTATLAITDRWFLSAGIASTGDSRGMAIWRFSFR